MLIYERSIPLSAEVVPLLEVYFEEQEMPPWSIHQNVLTGAYTLMGYFEADEAAEAGYEALRAEFDFLPEVSVARELQPVEWQEAYKEYLKPWHSRSLHWVPNWEWEGYLFPEAAVAVRLEPGMAFGTGSHETTRLVAERLLDIKTLLGDKVAALKVIDAGCGSGILALSAYKLGFGFVAGFDIDPDAVRISQEHCALNELPQGAIAFYTAGLPGGLEGRSADVLMANIQTDVLIPFAETLIKAVALRTGQERDMGSALILSGILSKELEQVRAVFEPLARAHGTLRLCDSRVQGEWADLYFAW